MSKFSGPGLVGKGTVRATNVGETVQTTRFAPPYIDTDSGECQRSTTRLTLAPGPGRERTLSAAELAAFERAFHLRAVEVSSRLECGPLARHISSRLERGGRLTLEVRKAGRDRCERRCLHPVGRGRAVPSAWLPLPALPRLLLETGCRVVEVRCVDEWEEKVNYCARHVT